MRKINNDGVTLMSLVITIIVLLLFILYTDIIWTIRKTEEKNEKDR